MKAFITIKNKPALKKTNGNAKNFNMGLTKKLSMAIVRPTIIKAI
jgi:hypothetical protein